MEKPQNFPDDWETYYPRVVRCAYFETWNLAEAEDIAHDVWVKINQKPEGFTAGTNFRAWLFKIAYNTLLDRLRKERRMVSLVEESALECPSEAVEQVGLDQEQAECIQRALQDLPDDERRVIVLKFYEGMKQIEIARILGVANSTVTTRLKKVLEKLKLVLAPLVSVA